VSIRSDTTQPAWLSPLLPPKQDSAAAGPRCPY